MAYVNGDYSYISTALRANFLTTNEMTTRLEANRQAGQLANVTGDDGYKLLLMTAKTNAILLSLLTRHQFVESHIVEMEDKVKK